MRNLKKILALALALVMALSVMSVASAKTLDSYADANQVSAKHEVAVDVATQLGILEGMTENSYAPQGTLTRAQLATMIYRITTGDTKGTYVSNFAAGAEAKFSDVKSTAWYAGYVGYCADAGYLQGMGDGTYAPNSTLTGYQALAALLRAIGYNQPGEFTGADWTVRVAQVATQTGVASGVITDLNKAITREQAAQFVFNALFTAKVEYTPAFGYSSVTSLLGVTDDLATDVFHIETGKYGEAGNGDVFNRPNTVWKYTAAYGGTVAVSIAADPVLTYTTAVSQCDLSTALGKQGVWTAQYSLNGSTVSNISLSATAVGVAVPGSAQGTLTEVYAVGGGYRIVEIETWLAKVDTVVKATYDVANHVITPSSTLFDVYGGNDVTVATEAYAKDSYVLLTWSAKTGKVVDITPVSPVAVAKLTSFTYGAGMTVGTTTVGATYNNAAKFALGTPVVANIGKNYNVYLDTYGNVIGLVEYVPTTLYNYGIMTDIAWQGSWGLANEQILANVMAMNGAVASNVTIANQWTNAGYNAGAFGGVAAGASSVGYNKSQNTAFYTHLYQFVIGETGAYEVTNVGTHLASVNITNSSPYIASTSGWVGNIVANDNTVYLVKTIEKGQVVYTSYTGYKTVPTMIGATACFFANATNSYVEYIYVDATAAQFPTASSNALIVITDTGVDAVNVDKNNGYVVWNGTTAEIKYVAGGKTIETVGGFVDTNAVYQATYNANGEITALKKLLWNASDAPLNTATLLATFCDGTVIRNTTAAAAEAYNCTGMNIYVINTATGVVTAGTIADVANAAGVQNYMVLNQFDVVTATYIVK